jgi:2-dehydro-3-deoxy-D-pentonate aldolase
MYNGVTVPTVTLLQRDGSLASDENRRHVDFLISSNVHGIYILGTTGEFMHFNLRERESHAATIVEHVNGRLPVIVGAASTATDDAMRLSRHAQGIGASAVTITTPYFWTLSEREVIGHFSSVASAVDIPILVYNVPSYSGFNISNATLITLMREHENIVGVIDAVDSNDLIHSRVNALREVNPEFRILSGSDGQILNLFELGGDGIFPATANIVPHVHVGIYDAFRTGDYQKSMTWYRELSQILSIYGVEGSFHSVVKEAMAMLGLTNNPTVRMPALPLTEESRALLRDVLTSSGVLAIDQAEDIQWT